MNALDGRRAAAATTARAAGISTSRVTRTINNLIPMLSSVKLSKVPFWDKIEASIQERRRERDHIQLEETRSTRRIYLYDDLKYAYYSGDVKAYIGLSIQRILLDLKEFIEFAEEVNKFLDIAFVLEEAPKYEIKSLSTEDPDCHCFSSRSPWDDRAIAKIRWIDGYYRIYFNLDIDREEAADYLSNRTGILINPEEIYYYAWFHECAHTRTVAGDLSQQSLFSKNFFLGQKLRGKHITRGLVDSMYRKAEEKADEWAKMKFREWRDLRRRTGL
ncbi:MAG TPA: hypothetical protein ENI51_10700 [Candidatus Atribacteria bacterium]|nr:hypothetical protein [Candidatus Atribacteria bacterium]